MKDVILEGLTKFPHRSSTTAAEKQAADYLVEKLQGLGLAVTVEPFTAITTFSWVYFLLYAGFALATAVHYFLPALGFGLLVLFTVLFVGEQLTWWSPLSRLVPRGESQNVLARLEPETGENLLVLVAHYDTSKTALAFSPGTVKYLRLLFKVSLFMLLTALLGAGLHLFRPDSGWSALDYLLLMPILYFLYAAGLMVERELRGKPVQGAADNASGVAVAVELMKRLKDKGGLPGWKARLLLTGAEEVGMAGMSAFLEQHGREFDPARSVFLNFDNIGAGRLTYVTGEGMLKRFPGDPELIRLAVELSREEPFQSVQGRDFRALTLDTLVANARGFRVLSFMGLNENGVAWPWHWHDDILENIDREVLDMAAEFAWALMGRLAAKPAAS